MLLALSTARCAPAAAAPLSCGLAVVVEGDQELSANVATELARRGFDTHPEPGCPVTRATIVRRGADVEVTVVDRYGRRSTRVVGPETAATVVESWARVDLGAAALPAPGVRADQPTAPRAPREEPAGLRPIAAPVMREVGSVALGAETAVGTDGSVWAGAALGACVRLGPVCPGVLVHVTAAARAPAVAGGAAVSRTAVDVLVAVGLPLRLGRASLTPGVTLGVAWLRTSADVANNNVDVDSGGLRVGAHLGLTYLVGRRLALDVGLAADVAPLARPSARQVEAVTVPGEPRGYVRVNLGLRYGAP